MPPAHTMDLETEILALRSKQQVERLVRWVGSDTGRFAQLMDLMLKGDRRTAQLAAWVVGHSGERHPDLVQPYLNEMIRKVKEEGIHDSVKRGVVRTLQYVEIPRRLQGSVVNLCFDYLGDVAAPIAVRACAMTVLIKLTREEPDLRNELVTVVRQMLPYSTPAFAARARRILNLPEFRRSSFEK